MANLIIPTKTVSDKFNLTDFQSDFNELANRVSSLTNLLVPTGAVQAFAMNSNPSGWLKCDGSAVSRSAYSALFTAIGVTYGAGDGSTTFNLPDLRGYFVRGYDAGRGIDGDSNRVFGSAQGDDFLSHDHVIDRPLGSYGKQSSGWGPVYDWHFDNDLPYNYSVSVHKNGGAETRPKNIALLYCIKY